jgi:hypothetical protein
MLFKEDKTLANIMNNKEETEKLILKIKFIHSLIKSDSDLFTIKEKLQDKEKIQEIFELEEDDKSAIAQLLEEIDGGAKLEKPLTKTSFYDAIIDDWFQSKVVVLMLAAEMPNGHDPIDDFLNFAYLLAEKMKLADLKSVSPGQQIWNELFKSTDPDLIRGLNACPLIAEGNKVKFADDGFIDYFIVRKSYEQFLNDKNYEQYNIV